jgi:formiminoglutamase
MKQLPVLLSIPHSGTEIPEELRDRVQLVPVDVWDDIDAFSRQVYDLGDRVAAVITTDVARTFVDPNRAPDDRPPDNPDGVVKSHTCYNRVIYKEGLEPDEALIELLLEKYYEPYHRRIRDVVQRGPSAGVVLGVDCHTMSALGPDVAPDPGGIRPMVCLGNLHGQGCSQQAIDRMTSCFVEAFGFNSADVTQNEPFAGAYITRSYGGNPIPWIQVEMNQSLYLKPRQSDREVPRVDLKRQREMRSQFERALRLYFAQPS